VSSNTDDSVVDPSYIHNHRYPLSDSKIDVLGPIALHNHRCAVLHDEYAVLDLSRDVFQPSWKAQEMGWRLVKADTWLQKMALCLFKNGGCA
jgi:hypothetical protein